MSIILKEEVGIAELYQHKNKIIIKGNMNVELKAVY